MNPQLRLALVMCASAGLAVWLGIRLADSDYFWPGLTAAIALAAICSRVLQLPADLILLGFALIGYLVGNRGFAQVTPMQGVPLFPAEAALMTAFAWRIIACAHERRIGLPRDWLSWIVLAWLAVGTVRVGFDVPRHGLNAIRDYAMVYYALFYFLVQHMVRSPGAEGYLKFCLMAGLLLLPLFYFLSQLAPGLFLDVLTLRGTPLIFYKGDLVHGFMIAGSVLLFFGFKGPHAHWARPLSIGLVLYVMPGDSRAAVVGAAVISGLFLLARRWTYPLWHLSLTTLAALVVLGLAVVANNDWAERKLGSATEKLRSIVDIQGVRPYQDQESLYKADNNRFRLVWWKNVALETVETNPVFGLGFGHDMAAGFLREYYPDSGEDFSARSPHNMFVTAFGRMGAVGLAVWTAFAGAVFLRIWRALRRNDERVFPLWTFGGVLVVTATFGVVLEGPMAAVPFWTVLGLANALDHRPGGEETGESDAGAEAEPAEARPAAATA